MAKEFRENFIGILALLIVSLTIYGLVKLNTHVAAAATKVITPESHGPCPRISTFMPRFTPSPVDGPRLWD